MAAAKVVALVGTSLISSAITYFTLVDHREAEKEAKSKESSERIKTVVVTRSEEEKAKEKADKWLPLRETKNNPPLNPNSLASKLSINDVDCDGKRVLVRVDYNVPMKKDKEGNQVVADPRRIEETVDTLRLLLAKKGPKGGVKCIVLIAHLGQPTGKYNKADFTLQPCVKVLEDYLKVPVTFLPDCVGPDVEQAINDCKPGSVFLCENLRFHTEEIGSGEDEKGQKIKAKPDAIAKFQESLTRLGDVFVFEAFGAAHRPHSSINGIKIPVRVAGLLVQKELGIFSQVLSNPKRPCLAVLGGAKVSDKIQVIENMLDLVDEMIIGGGMAYTFKKVAHKVDIGASIFDKEGANSVERILKKAQERGVKMHFPVDHVIADKFSADARTGVTDDVAGVPAGWMALDVGPKSRANFSAVCERAETIIWNGPMGVFEKGPFAAGTLSLMCDLCVATKRGATTIIGGGETGQASNAFHYRHTACAEQVTHVSTGGGSSLVLLEGKQLPGVQGITEKAEYASQSSSSGSVAATAAVFESGSKPGKSKEGGKEKKKN